MNEFETHLVETMKILDECEGVKSTSINTEYDEKRIDICVRTPPVWVDLEIYDIIHSQHFRISHITVNQSFLTLSVRYFGELDISKYASDVPTPNASLEIFALEKRIKKLENQQNYQCGCD